MTSDQVYLKHYDDYVDIYQAKGTGLSLICISSDVQNPFDVMEYHPSKREEIQRNIQQLEELNGQPPGSLREEYQRTRSESPSFVPSAYVGRR